MRARNVHEALVLGCRAMRTEGIPGDSRNGGVLRYPGPFVTTYERPTERVESHPERDSNPFFHLMEALWMLGGRRDVAFPARFNSKFGQFSDDGKVFHGAYGWRWRHRFAFDQLDAVVSGLHKRPDCRRQVVAMWDGQWDLLVDSKDVPCNLSAVVQRSVDGRLDLTVFNRSNDLIWGTYGANAVHFSVLQEYLAARLGWPVGEYHQVSANTHVYRHHWPLMEALSKKPAVSPYETATAPTPLLYEGEDPVALDQDVADLLDDSDVCIWETSLFRTTVAPMLAAWEDRANALSILRNMRERSDWRAAAEAWVQRRAR